MKIAQFHHENRIRLGQIQDESIVPIDFYGDMISYINNDKRAYTQTGEAIPLDQVRLAPVVTRPAKIIGIGLNYKDHAAEQNEKLPDAPRIFAKFPNTLIGPNDPITWNITVTNQVDFEAELAVIIGKTVQDCSEEEALAAVFGYTCANDVSARDIQFTNAQLVCGKSLDTFCPLGPWIVTRDEIPDPNRLKIRSWLNDNLMQDSHTGLMIFSVPYLISFLSHRFTLEAGDVILTGSPKGVGAFRNPPIFMKAGDTLTIEVEGIGRLANTCQTR
jgi:2-keto-4-pentenoate hydratase/2-oxohepta-3-ene-1,7-dioic acid hydratase in catechol pathway